MATLTATKSGNWSDSTVWGGSTPADGDTVSAASYIIDFDVDVAQPNTLLTSTTGYFQYTGAGTRTVQAKANAGTHTTAGLILMSGAGTLTFDGPVKGGASGGAYGAFNNTTGTLNVTTATGGAGDYAHGAFNNGAGTLNVTTATGGAGDQAHGARNNGAGTLTVTTATGGVSGNAHGAYNYGAGTLRCDLAVGGNWGVGGSGSYTHGVYGNGAAGQVTTVKRVQSGPYGCAAIGGAVFIEPDASNSAQFRKTPNGATLTLVDAAATADFPAESDVRHGVEYDDGSKTGTAYIPAADQVALGVPVDATTGTAVLTAAAMLAAMNASPPAVKLDAAQGVVTFDQVKILANVAYEGALHVMNSHASGLGQYNYGGSQGQVNAGNDQGQHNIGTSGQGQLNEGGVTPVSGVDDAGIRAAVGLASSNLDTQLSGIASNVSTALARLGAWAGSGINNVLGALRAMMRADATTPSDIGGTYSPPTDSLEALAAGGAINPQDVADAMALATAETPAAGSVLARLAAIQVVTDSIDVSAVTVAPSNVAGTLALVAGRTFEAVISGAPVAPTWERVYWTLKRTAAHADGRALAQVRVSNPPAVGDGLVRLDGAAVGAPLAATDGALTVDQVGQRVTVWLSDEATAELEAAAGLVWDLKVLDAGESVGVGGGGSVVRGVTGALA